MTNKVEHTTGPWRWEKELYRTEDGVIIGKQSTICRVTRTNQAPNAEFIVRACNNHDALLEACKAMQVFVDWWLSTPQHDQQVALRGQAGDELIGKVKDICNQAQDAIAAAEGKQ